MNDRTRVDRSAVRAAATALALASGLALANLPGADLPAGWLVAFVVPGALLGRHGARLRPGWLRALVAVTLQALACWAALAAFGPLARPAALACTILPPLGFATARHQPADRPLALFLGFCVLLVGTILGGVHVPLVLGWTAAATLALRCGERLGAVEEHGAPLPTTGPTVPAVRPGLALVLGALVAVGAIEQVLAWLPSPGRGGGGGSPARPTGNGPEGDGRRIGLDDVFELGAAAGDRLGPADGEVLVRARMPVGQSVADDLYLRSGHFARAGLGRWQTGTLAPRPVQGDVAVLAEARPGERARSLELERTAGARDLVFVPPHPLVVGDCTGLMIDPVREWVRTPDRLGPLAYTVSFRQIRRLPADARTGTADAELLALPAGLQRERWDALLASWQVPVEPVAAMARIAAELQRHCAYDRREPTGPFGNALENFLFAADERHGYCMHFASAAAVLLRLRGIPCRVAIGVHGGEPDPQRPGTRRYTSEHAHAWVEVPFAGRGFEVFDPTPPAERGRRAPAGTLGQNVTPPPDETDDGTGESPRSAIGFDVGVALAIGAAIGLTLLMVRPRARAAHVATPAVDDSTRRHARQLLTTLLHELAAAGHARAPGRTLEAYVRELAVRSWLPPEIAAAFLAWQQVRFGERPFDGDRERLLRQGIATAQALRARTSGVPARR